MMVVVVVTSLNVMMSVAAANFLVVRIGLVVMGVVVVVVVADACSWYQSCSSRRVHVWRRVFQMQIRHRNERREGEPTWLGLEDRMVVVVMIAVAIVMSVVMTLCSPVSVSVAVAMCVVLVFVVQVMVDYLETLARRGPLNGTDAGNPAVGNVVAVKLNVGATTAKQSPRPTHHIFLFLSFSIFFFSF
jgi:hypothetical protein